MCRFWLRLHLGAILAAWTVFPAWGLANTPAKDAEEPLIVESNEMVIKDAEQKAVYTGDVKARKGEMVLHAARLVVYYNSDGIQRAHAIGKPVTLEQAKRRGRAQEAFYNASDRSLLMVGNARLEEGPNTLQGARIRYFMDQRRTEVYSGEEKKGGRARAVFQPDNPPGQEDEQQGESPKQETE